jgi:hypothetical protein
MALFIDDEGTGSCDCTYNGPGYYIRPEIGIAGVWGGVNSDVCGGGNDQTMTVQFAVTTTSGGGGSGASDNCAGAAIAQIAGLASGSSYPVGTTTNTLRITDASGNTADCSFTVTVEDNELPTITCPADMTVSTDAGLCSAVVSYTLSSTDNCPGQTVTQTTGRLSTNNFPKGTTTNTFVVTDASGNTATCSFTVTVEDNEDPTITCPADVTVTTDAGQCTSVQSYSVSSTDNCPAQTIAQTAGEASGFAFPKGTTTNTFVVTDASGNTATCSFSITVNDVELTTIT